MEGLKAKAVATSGDCPHDKGSKEAYIWWKSPVAAAYRRALSGISRYTPGSVEDLFWSRGYAGKSFFR